MLDSGDELLVNMISEATLMSPSHWAAYQGDEQVITELLNNGANPFKWSLMGLIPIDVAGSCHQYEVVDVFLKLFDKLRMQGRTEIKDPNHPSTPLVKFSDCDTLKPQPKYNLTKMIKEIITEPLSLS